ncbi:hypothetical protein [Leptolyngbya iicbica]|uniref:SPOR domain-containing protein n=2 Tax=Cyanophyceae TaxID=3028117 RepID=A0A4Q7E008_9CYAN|nr:hypothetical protein [Leptolyngbya sp. LK]RZM74432.1 hypothetical protein DYY88_23505 [Leptolyngbya sp. LK]
MVTSRFRQWCRPRLSGLPIACLLGGGLGLAIALPSVAATLTAPEGVTDGAIAQALPTPLPPLPTNSGVAPTSGDQYLVLVNGSSDLLLQQVRQVEPGAFVNFVDGQSVIQAGRFNSYENAQYRANELAGFGITADVQSTDYASAPIAVTPPSDYSLAYPATGQGVAQPFPSNTVAATPSTIEFGQAAPFGSAAPTSAAAFPPSPSNVSYPSGPPTGATPPPLTTPAVVQGNLASGYYVVVPGSSIELQQLANQIVSLGAPSVLVQSRTAPRGPHVAVGPYGDYDIAQEWNNYLRDSGIAGARVHFQ